MPAPIDIDRLLEVRPGFRSDRPCITGTGVTVHTVAIYHGLGMTPQEIVDGFPQTSLAGIHAALAYYFAHREAVDAELDDDDRLVDRVNEIPNARVV